MRSDADATQRNFSFMSMLGFSCTVMITWEAMLLYVCSLITRFFAFSLFRTLVLFLMFAVANVIVVSSPLALPMEGSLAPFGATCWHG